MKRRFFPCAVCVSIVWWVVAALGLAGCAEPDRSMRSMSQHPANGFLTVETNEGEQGIYFWGCLQHDDELVCNRICDDDFSAGRICGPELAGEFGEISGPPTGAVAKRYRDELGDRDAERDGEQDADHRRRFDDDAQEDGEADEEDS